MKMVRQDTRRSFSVYSVNMIIAVMVAFFSFPTIAVSQETELQNKDSRKQHQLESITVTAQKREENVQDVPISISIFNESDLENAEIEDARDLVRFAPNVHLKESSAENSLIIRGVSSFDTSIYSPVGVYVDGVNLPLHYMFDIELLDLERAEVLRGPQGTLYGRNSESGVLNLVTKQPEQEFRARIFTKYGNYNSWRFGSSFSGPIVDNRLYLGAAFQYKLSDGYIENNFTGDDKSAEKNRKNGRATLRWTPTDQLDISLIADIMDFDDQQNSYRYRTGPYATDSHEVSHNFTDEYSEQKGNGQTLRVKYASKDFDLISITGLRNYVHRYNTDMDCTDDTSGPFNWGGAPNEYDIEHLSEEFRISSPEDGGPFQWLVGVYAFKEDTEIISNRPSWGMAADTDIHIDGYAGFGQGTYTFFDKLHLTAGLRLDHQDLEGKIQGTGSSGRIDLEKDLDYDEWLPKFSASYDLTKDMMVYGSASKGYSVGGYNYGYMPSKEEAFYFDPEYTWNYEMGIKSSWLNKKLFANLSVFYIDIDDKQVVEYAMALGNNIKNAASAHSQGVELELRVRPLPGLDLTAGFGYVESKFDDWETIGSDGKSYDFEGNYLPNTPKHNYNLGVSYRHPEGCFARVDLLGRGAFYGDVRNTTKQKAYEILNLRMGYEGEHWGVTFWGENLLDEEYVTALFDNSNMGLGELVQDGEPRTFGVTASYRF